MVLIIFGINRMCYLEAFFAVTLLCLFFNKYPCFNYTKYHENFLGNFRLKKGLHEENKMIENILFPYGVI